MYNSNGNLIIGFNGCDEKIQNALLAQPNKMLASDKPYDWWGHGIFFGKQL